MNDDKKCEEMMNTIIIKKNTPIPCSVTEDFYVRYDGQEAIDASITQGEETDPDLVSIVSNQTFRLPPNTPQGSVIRVTYSYDKDQRMDCTFLHVDSGKKVCLQVDTKNIDDSSNSSSFPVFLNCSRESREVPEFIVPTLIEKNTNFFG